MPCSSPGCLICFFPQQPRGVLRGAVFWIHSHRGTSIAPVGIHCAVGSSSSSSPATIAACPCTTGRKQFRAAPQSQCGDPAVGRCDITLQVCGIPAFGLAFLNHLNMCAAAHSGSVIYIVAIYSSVCVRGGGGLAYSWHIVASQAYCGSEVRHCGLCRLTVWSTRCRTQHTAHNGYHPGVNPCATKGCHPTKPRILCAGGCEKIQFWCLLLSKTPLAVVLALVAEVLPLQRKKRSTSK